MIKAILFALCFLVSHEAVAVESLNDAPAATPGVSIDPTIVNFQTRLNQLMAEVNRLNRVELLAPKAKKRFDERVAEARKQLEKGDPFDRLEKTFQEAIALKGEIQKSISQGEIEYAKQLMAFEDMSKRYSSDQFKKQMEAVGQTFRDGAEKIEEGNLADARERCKSIDKALFDAEVAGARDFYLKDISAVENELNLDQIKRDLPKSVADAAACRSQLVGYIEIKPGDREKIEASQVTCLDRWYRLKNIYAFLENARAKGWGTEDFLLFYDSQLDEVTTASGRTPDPKLTILSKFANLKDFMRVDQASIWKAKEALSQAEEQAQVLRRKQEERQQQLASAKKRLRAEQERKALYQKMQKLFEPGLAAVKIDGPDIEINIFGLTFQPGSADVTSKAFPILEKIKKAIQMTKGNEIEIIGHTDSEGDPKGNRKLSESRASTVLKFLLTAGAVEERVIRVRGVGSEKPLKPNNSPENRAKNRRVELRIKNVG